MAFSYFTFFSLFLSIKGHGYPSSPNNATNLSIDYNIPNTVSYVPTVSDGTTAPAPSRTVIVSIAKMVNPQGTVTTITSDNSNMIESFSSDRYIHENCDESMFRPVTVIGKSQRDNPVIFNPENIARPVDMPSQLIVPVIDERALLQKQKEREEQQKVLKLLADEKKIEEIKKQLETDAKLEEITVMSKKGKKDAKNMKKEKSPPVEMALLANEMPQKVVFEENVEFIDPELVAQKLPEKVFIIKVIPKVQVDENAQKSREPIMPKSFSELMKKDAKENLDDDVFVEKVEIKNEVMPSKSLSLETQNFVEQKPVFVEIKLPDPEGKLDAIKKPEPKAHKSKKDKEAYKKKGDKFKQQQQVEVKPKIAEKVLVLPTAEIEVFEEIPPLGKLTDIELPPPPLEDHHDIDYDAIMKISKHETIGDDDIEIIPHQNSVEIKDSPEKSPEIEIIEMPTQESPEKCKKVGRKLIKNEDFYDLGLSLDDLPALEPLAPLEALELFDTTFESLCFKDNSNLPLDTETKAECSMNLERSEQSDDEYQQKQDMKKKMSEMLKDTNMVFAMCSSLKEMKVEDDGDNRSLTSSQIQTSTSSTTTTTTTTTFATDSVSSNQIGEGLDSDYKSLELENDENFEEESKLDDEDSKLPQKKEVDGLSSYDTNSSDEADDNSSSKKLSFPKMNCNDDEETRPLITSVSSELSPSPVVAMSPVQVEISNIIITEITTAIETPTLPDLNQKTTNNNNSSGGNNKRKSKKKKR